MELTCYATGEPQASIRWSGDNWSERYGVPGTDTVALTAAKPSDSGVYSCTAENSVGRDEQRLRLVVEPAGAPLPALRPGALPVAGRPAEFVPGPAAGVVRVGRDVYTVPLNGRAELSCAVQGEWLVPSWWVDVGGSW